MMVEKQTTDGQTAEPVSPLGIKSEEDFLAKLAKAEKDVAAGHVKEARAVAHDLGEKYHLA